jgi:hypothetical protein
MAGSSSRLTRPINLMPDFIREALTADALMDAYDARPDYQRNDYLGWIMRARRADTRQKRLNQMLDELRQADVYMGMAWTPRDTVTDRRHPRATS